jgi:hypothetical protein
LLRDIDRWHGHGGRVRARVAVIGIVIRIGIGAFGVIEERVDPHGWHYGVRGAGVMVPGVWHRRRVVWCVLVWCLVVRDRCGEVRERRPVRVADDAL